MGLPVCGLLVWVVHSIWRGNQGRGSANKKEILFTEYQLLVKTFNSTFYLFSLRFGAQNPTQFNIAGVYILTKRFYPRSDVK